MKRKLMLIINPAAGRGSYKNNLGEALQILDNGGYRTSLFFTAGSGDATEYAARYGGDYDTVACIGGDGTLSEVISGLMRLEARPEAGVTSPWAPQTTWPPPWACPRTTRWAPPAHFIR